MSQSEEQKRRGLPSSSEQSAGIPKDKNVVKADLVRNSSITNSNSNAHSDMRMMTEGSLQEAKEINEGENKNREMRWCCCLPTTLCLSTYCLMCGQNGCCTGCRCEHFTNCIHICSGACVFTCWPLPGCTNCNFMSMDCCDNLFM